MSKEPKTETQQQPIPKREWRDVKVCSDGIGQIREFASRKNLDEPPRYIGQATLVVANPVTGQPEQVPFYFRIEAATMDEAIDGFDAAADAEYERRKEPKLWKPSVDTPPGGNGSRFAPG